MKGSANKNVLIRLLTEVLCSLSLSLELIIYLYLIYRYREEGGTLGNAPTGATAAVLVPVETE